MVNPLAAAIGAIVMGVCFSTMAVAQAPVEMNETQPASIMQAKSTGAGVVKKSRKKSGKQQKGKKRKRGNSNSKRSRPPASSYKVFTS